LPPLGLRLGFVRGPGRSVPAPPRRSAAGTGEASPNTLICSASTDTRGRLPSIPLRAGESFVGRPCKPAREVRPAAPKLVCMSGGACRPTGATD
jgi:hypothetical protein